MRDDAISLAFLTLFLGSAAYCEEPVSLAPGAAKLLKFEKSFSTVIVGNPKIVEATPQTDKVIVLTAKDVRGITNVILLDEQANEVSNIQVSVRGSDILGKVQIHPRSSGGRGQATVHEYRAYSCQPVCERIEDKLEVDLRTREQSEQITTTREGESDVTRSQSSSPP